MQMLKLYYHPESILRRAPSNKPVHLIGGRTIHFGQDLIPENCMRTVSLAVKAQSRQKFSFTHDESSQLQRELDDAEASYKSKKAKMEELQTGDAVAFANIMYWHVLGEDHFDLGRIVSALGVRGEAEDLSMIRVIERI